MDKRTLIFTISLFLTLFGVKQYFEYQKALENAEYKKQLLAWEAEQRVHWEKEAEGRLANISDLPLVSVSRELNDEPFAQAVLDNGALLLTSFDAPESVYVGGERFFALPQTIDGITLYARNSSTKPKANALPMSGSNDLQVVTSDGRVVLGIVTNGRLSIPIDVPTENALLLAKKGGEYRPVGLYLAAEERMLSMQELLGFDAPEAALPLEGDETYYLLENGVQQLVFSSIGGALVELNLPFIGEEHPNSSVRPIEFDREMVEQHPDNAYFPQHKALRHNGSEIAQGSLGGYYPLLRRNLIGDNGQPLRVLPPQYYALNIVSSYPEVAQLSYKVTHFDKQSITFEAVQRHRRITKTFRLSNDPRTPYMVELELRVDGDSRGLWLTSGVPEVELVSGSPAPALKSRVTRGETVEVNNLDLPADSITVSSTQPDWICNSNGFLGLILDPLTKVDAGYRLEKVDGVEVPTKLVEIDAQYQRFQAANLPGYQALLPLSSNGGTMQFRIYAGPFAGDVLKMVDKAYSDGGYNPDYISSQSFHGWFAFISAPFSKLLFVLMNLFHTLTHSWAASIVLLTVVLRAMLYPLNSWSMRSMRRMQKIAPEVQAIQNKYKKDPQKAQMEIMNLYRERGANPMMGCFPMLIQMPFLIGMFDLLKSSTELRGAPFIPGWIDNLTAPDVLFNWGVPLPFFGSEFHLLPLMLGGIMWLQQRMSSSMPKDVSEMTEQQRQQKAMGNMMTLLFAVMFYHFPSGLNIYWLSSMGLGILQQWLVNRSLDKEDQKPVVMPAK